MSKKYVIEIKPEYEDTTRGIMVLGARDSNLYMDALAVEDMEELTADYINEHYGSLQDDAYQRGLEDGKQTAVGAAELREKLEYQKGFEDGKAIHEKGCEGCKYGGTPQGDSQCFNCSNYYKSNWTAKDDKIVVGDEVERYINGKLDSKGIYLGDTDEEGDYWNCLFWTGACYVTLGYPKHQFKKTGRHFDIASILEEMRND